MNEFAEEKIDNITCDSFNFQESLADIDITEAIVSLVDRSIAINRHLMPIKYDRESQVLLLVTYDTENILQKNIILDQLQKNKPGKINDIKILMVEYDEFSPVFERFFGVSSGDTSNDSNADFVQGKTSAAQDLFDRIKSEARQMGASDIHITPYRVGAIVQFRIHGKLYKPNIDIDEPMKNSLANVIKTWCHLNTEVKKVPLDGSKNEGDADYRISTYPTVVGEKITIRIFDQGNKLSRLDNLHMHPDDLETIKLMLMAPSGMILCTGPTGSGKTTIQYAALAEKGSKDNIILSIEDPVEQKIDGVSQSQVTILQDNEAMSNTMIKALRASLRQDPNIILVGEIRDYDTADVSIQASQTGHLVFSTLHTKSAIAAVDRVANMGISRYQFLSEIVGIIGQRLLARSCPHCREEVVSEYNKLLPKKYLEQLPGGITMRSKGCSKCGNTGIVGRLPILEIIRFNDELRDLFSEQVGWVKSKELLKKNNFITLWQRGFELVKNGEVSLEELCSELAVSED